MKKIKIGDLGFLFGHILKAIKIKHNPFGNIIDWSCYNCGCCTIPNILNITCSEKDSLLLKNNYRDFKK